MSGDVAPDIASSLGVDEQHLKMLQALCDKQLAAGRLTDAWETLDVLTTLRPFDANLWKLMAQTERRRGREEHAKMCEEAASWFG